MRFWWGGASAGDGGDGAGGSAAGDGALSRAVTTLEAYRDGSEFFFPYESPSALAASVEACAMRLAGALQAECD